MINELKLKKYLKNSIINDFVFKFIANTFTIIFRNIIVLPILALLFTKSEYGEMITIIGVITTISAGFGNSLLSVRLIMDSEYRERKIQGDFNNLCLLSSFLSIFFIFLIKFLFPKITLVELGVILVILFLETFIGYHSGWFILRQEYKKLLYYTIFSGIGFTVGIFFTYSFHLWSLTYLFSDIFCMIFLCKYSPLIKEKMIFTDLIHIVKQKYYILIVSTVLVNALSYLDRLFLYPIMGSEVVAIYTTASVFGKAFNLIALPVSSILLGYYASDRIRLNINRFWIVNLSTWIVLLVFIILTKTVGVWATGILYPSLIDEAAPYILIANLSSSIGASAQITKSAALKYAKTRWILIIQIIYALFYLIGGYFGIYYYGLNGFSFSVLIANIVQISVLYIICHISIKQN